jgi:hypothetical protein
LLGVPGCGAGPGLAGNEVRGQGHRHRHVPVYAPNAIHATRDHLAGFPRDKRDIIRDQLGAEP